MTDQVEVDDSHASLVLNDAQPGMQIKRSIVINAGDVVQDILNPTTSSILTSSIGHNVQPKFYWGDLENEKLIGDSHYVQSKINCVNF